MAPKNPGFGKRLTQAISEWEIRHYPTKLPDIELGAKLIPAVTSQAVSRWRAGKEPRGLGMISQLAAILEVDPRWLAFGEDVPRPETGNVPRIMQVAEQPLRWPLLPESALRRVASPRKRQKKSDKKKPRTG